MVALLGELVAKGEPIFLDESLESLQSPVVRVKENLGQRDNLQKVHVNGFGNDEHMHTALGYYIPFAHVANSINWARNSLVSSPFLSKDLCKQEAEHTKSNLKHRVHVGKFPTHCLLRHFQPTKLQSMCARAHNVHTLQGLFQDFASEGANAKFQNSRGGKYKAKEGQPHIKRTEKPIPRGQKHPLGPPEINPALYN